MTLSPEPPRPALGARLLLLLALVTAGSPARAFEVADYDVRVQIDAATLTVRGQETLQVVGPSGPALTFPRNGITVTACSGATVTATDTALAFALSRPLRPGEQAEIRIDYEARSPRGMHIAADLTTTAFHTCHWMVCLEDPAQRATATLRIVTRATDTVVASGSPVSRAALPGGLALHVWRQDPPVPAFLLGFVAGDLDRVTGSSGAVSLEVLGHRVPTETLQAVLDATAPMIPAIEDLAGLPFPLATYRQVVVPGGAAQEMAGYALLGQDHVAPLVDDPTEDWLVFHELAHQVWGSQLACASWRDLWLNEGVVTYLVGAWKQRRWGHPVYERELRLARQRSGRAAAAGLDVPLTHPGPWPSLGAQRAIVYSKGALLLSALRRELGDATFWRALRIYTQRHAGRVVTTADLRAVLDEVAGRDLGPLLAPWLGESSAE